jgi:hypothetical protein
MNYLKQLIKAQHDDLVLRDFIDFAYDENKTLDKFAPYLTYFSNNPHLLNSLLENLDTIIDKLPHD